MENTCVWATLSKIQKRRSMMATSNPHGWEGQLLSGALEYSRGVFGDCAPEVPALQCRWKFFYSGGSYGYLDR